jgi:hypothetical protein
VTEQEWLDCLDPEPMLAFLRGRASDRKLRLFCCGCARRVRGRLYEGWDRLFPPIIDRAERDADGQATGEELSSVELEANIPANDLFDANDGYLRRHSNAILFAICAAGLATRRGLDPATLLREYQGLEEVRARVGVGAEVFAPDEASAQAHLLRDLFGNPFRIVFVFSSWLTWQDGLVPGLAHAGYDNRILPSGELDPARLAVLADALEEAGCSEDEILTHLRSPGPHVRGCWALDVVLGRG